LGSGVVALLERRRIVGARRGEKQGAWKQKLAT